ncbi:MAG TPA: glycogen debranching protein GlgX [Rhodopila sp.]|nr:glycogen debranching protein GlgX [Rhodopila sp.]
MTGSLTDMSDTLGVHVSGDGIAAAVYAPNAEAVAISLFDDQDRESTRLRLQTRIGPVFSGRFDGVPAGTRYGLRVYGPWDPAAGHRFNPAKLLFDPWATAIDRPFRLHPLLFDINSPKPDDTAPLMPKGIIGTPAASPLANRPAFDWDRQVIYELHVRGFTMTHPEIPAEIRGTFAALAHPAAIQHLTRLGVTTVEIMPSAAWVDERHLPALNRSNYWGYNPIAFLAPDPRLAPGGWAEVRSTVDALHAAGLNVVLDVVLNHSGESDELGATLSLRGLDNAAYYRLDTGNPALYANDAGCGNILAMDRPGPLRLGMDALRTWARFGGFDGFRLDLAATLGRRDSGFDRNAPFLQAIEQDPILSRMVMIAEPWDIGPDGYQLGAFPARWGEWNDRYRDDVRRFWRGDAGMLGSFTTRFAGSADVFNGSDRPLSRSINYITAHDGFTLADLVSFAGKHNEANGEFNRDGSDENFSWNNGVEGASADPAITAARLRDMCALLATLLLSRGTPMLSMGDELGRTQHGNNNAYMQDNAGSWIDWAAANDTLVDFTAELIRARRRLAPLFGGKALTGCPTGDEMLPDVAWLRPDGDPMTIEDWNGPGSRTLIAVLSADTCRAALVFHAGNTPLTVTLPPSRAGYTWTTSLGAQRDTEIPPRTVAVFEEVLSPASAARACTTGAKGTTKLRTAELGTAELGTAASASARATNAAAPNLTRHPSGVSDGELNALAERAGIDPIWWDIDGGRHVVSTDTKRALLAAMRLPATTRADYTASVARLDHDQSSPLPPVITGRIGTALAIPIGHPQPLWVTLQREDGSLERFPCCGSPLVLPAQPPGRHRLLNEDRPEHFCHLIIAPEACYLPPVLATGGQRFGIATHLYSLRSAGDQGVGDFTTLARLATQAAQGGAAMIGLNPLHALLPHDRLRISPYHPSDRRFLDPVYIDVSGFGGGPPPASAGASVDYPAVWAYKRAVLGRVVQPVPDMPEAMRRFATFSAIADVIGYSDWRNWPAGLRHPTDTGVARFAEQHREAVTFYGFTQRLAEQQLAQAAASATRDGLSLGFYRDLAVGAAPDGAEAWAAQDTLMFGVSVGAPPDPFSATGQVWSLPAPDPVAMRRDGFAAFDELLTANMRHAGALRIDHVMGLRRLFIVPDGASAADGAYISYPVGDLLAVAALRSQQARCLVVGEDLGTVPEGMSEALESNNVLSYSVLWFERREGKLRHPSEWRRLAAACVSTHDLPTLAGWWAGADIDEKQQLTLLDDAGAARARSDRQAEKIELIALLREERLLEQAVDLTAPLPDFVAAAVHGFVSATPALLALVQADDLAGELQAVNLPGTDRERPNWQRRLHTDVETLLHTKLARAILDALQHRKQTPAVDLP